MEQSQVDRKTRIASIEKAIASLSTRAKTYQTFAAVGVGAALFDLQKTASHAVSVSFEWNKETISIVVVVGAVIGLLHALMILDDHFHFEESWHMLTANGQDESAEVLRQKGCSAVSRGRNWAFYCMLIIGWAHVS